jgi:hypothetical protein
VPVVGLVKSFPDHILKRKGLRKSEYLADGKLADRDNYMRFEELDLADEKAPAVFNFPLIGFAVSSPLGIYSREASGDGGEVNHRTQFFLRQRSHIMEPFKESFTGGVSKGFAEICFMRTRCLPDKEDSGRMRISMNRCSTHLWAIAAAAQLFLKGKEFFHGWES